MAEVPKVCPFCGVEGSVTSSPAYYGCSDCGRSWPKPKGKKGADTRSKPKEK